MNKVLGVTGTRNGMTQQQFEMVSWLLGDAPFLELHHGDCIGVDAQVAQLASGLGLHITSHPPMDFRLRAYAPAHVVLEPKPFLIRNHDIVDVSGTVLVVPEQMEEIVRSGTWATFRYARKEGKRTIVIRPDGSRSE